MPDRRLPEVIVWSPRRMSGAARQSVLSALIGLAVLAALLVYLSVDRPGGSQAAALPAPSTTSGDSMSGMDMSGGSHSGMPTSGGDRPRMVVLPSHVADTRPARAKAEAFRQRVSATVKREGWTSEARIRAAGFQPMTGFDIAHWYNRANLTDGVQFDPARPEFLVVLGGRVLAEMFVPQTISLRATEPPGAPLMRWHYHRYSGKKVCTTPYITQYFADNGNCRTGDSPATHSPLMTHVWVHGMRDPFAAMMVPDDLH